MANVLTTPNTWTSVVNVLGDVVFVDIQNTISFNNTYCFNINFDSLGPKKIVFRIRQQTTDTDSDTDSNATEIETEGVDAGDDADMKSDDTEVGDGEIKAEDKDVVIDPEYQPVVASPCNLLTRRTDNPNPDPENPTAPWSYYVKKRAEAPM